MTLRFESGIPVDRIEEAGFDIDNDKVKQLIDLVGEIRSFPRHQSQHTGGFVLDNRKLTRLVPVVPARMENRTDIEWDKYDLDALGLMKVDVLALGIMTCIRKSMDLMNESLGVTGFDAAWCRWVACFVSSPATLVQRIADALRPGGLAIFQFTPRDAMWQWPASFVGVNLDRMQELSRVSAERQ